MSRWLPKLLPLLWALAIALLAAPLVMWLVERVYAVPLDPEHLRFERPWAWTLLPAAALVLIARGWWARKRSPRLRVSRAHDLAALRPGWRWWASGALPGLRAVAVGLLALALMGPQSIHARDTTDVEGIDIMLALDLSRSMQAADIEPNRFVASKQVVDEFIRRRPNDRLGAVVFGRDAYTLLPLTTDHQALHNTVDQLQLGAIEGRGTAIGNALGVALNRLRASDAETQVVILVTDGESNSGNIAPTQAAQFAETLGVKIYTVLMGRSDDAPVKRGTDLFGRALFDRGQFPINPELLREVASTTGGEAFQVTDREELEKTFHVILDRLEKSEIEDAGRVYGELFPAFAGPAFGLLLLELLAGSLWLRRWP